jgi:hypothetical protein
MDRLMADMADVKNTLADIQKKLNQAEGGWRALIWVGGVVSGLTGIAGFIAGHWGK